MLMVYVFSTFHCINTSIFFRPAFMKKRASTLTTTTAPNLISHLLDLGRTLPRNQWFLIYVDVVTQNFAMETLERRQQNQCSKNHFYQENPVQWTDYWNLKAILKLTTTEVKLWASLVNNAPEMRLKTFTTDLPKLQGMNAYPKKVIKSLWRGLWSF